MHTQASKRPLSTLMLQMAAQEEAAGRAFDEAIGVREIFRGKRGGFMGRSLEKWDLNGFNILMNSDK